MLIFNKIRTKKIYIVSIVLLFGIQEISARRKKKSTIKKEQQQKKKKQQKVADDVNKKVASLLKKQNEAVEYKVWIEGPECRICAKHAVIELSKLPGISSPYYVWINNDYKNSHAKCTIRPNEIDLISIENILINQKFKLKGLKGSFCGLLRQHGNGSWFFKPMNDLRKFNIGNQSLPAFEKLKRKKTLLKKPICLSGTLYFNLPENTFFVG